jgi:hypothetical protein
MGRWGDARERWLPRLAPALLIVVAIQQVALASLLCLNPWKGGGFGMFATTDRGGLRDVRAFALTPQGEARLRIPPELETQRLRVRDLPTDAALLQLGRNLLAQLPAEMGGRPAIRIEVGLRELDVDAVRLQRRVLRERVVPVDRER